MNEEKRPERRYNVVCYRPKCPHHMGNGWGSCDKLSQKDMYYCNEFNEKEKPMSKRDQIREKLDEAFNSPDFASHEQNYYSKKIMKIIDKHIPDEPIKEGDVVIFQVPDILAVFKVKSVKDDCFEDVGRFQYQKAKCRKATPKEIECYKEAME
ncbi:MAG: hypothetical protein GY861_14625 [bacterium]|nr:hypothetical protein [bacterium]